MRKLIITTLLALSVTGVNAQKSGNSSIFRSIRNGIASFYHDKFEGRKTATGEVFDNDKYTAASNSLKLGSYVKVTNLNNGQIIYVRVNDRMAKDNERLIDLASIAAKKLQFHKNGIAKVKVEPVPDNEGRRAILAQNGFEIMPGNKL